MLNEKLLAPLAIIAVVGLIIVTLVTMSNSGPHTMSAKSLNSAGINNGATSFPVDGYADRHYKWNLQK